MNIRYGPSHKCSCGRLTVRGHRYAGRCQKCNNRLRNHTPKAEARRRAYYKAYWIKLKADPVRYREWLDRMNRNYKLRTGSLS